MVNHLTLGLLALDLRLDLRWVIILNPLLGDLLVHNHGGLLFLLLEDHIVLGVVQGCRPGRLPIMEPIVLHMDLNFLLLPAAANYD